MIEQYYKDIRNIRLLTDEETLTLVMRYKAGDENAARQLVEHNLRLVIPLARAFANNGIEIDDLIQVGNLGLMKAVSLYEPDKATKFSSFAYRWIKTYIQRELEKQSRMLHVPTGVYRDISKLKKAQYLLMSKLMREPTTSETAKEIGWDEEKVITYKCLAMDYVSLQSNSTYIDDSRQVSEFDYEHTLPDKSVELKRELNDNRAELFQLMQRLPERDLEIVKLYYGIDCDKMTQQKIADDFGITKQRVQQIIARALRTMRKE